MFRCGTCPREVNNLFKAIWLVSGRRKVWTLVYLALSTHTPFHYYCPAAPGQVLWLENTRMCFFGCIV